VPFVLLMTFLAIPAARGRHARQGPPRAFARGVIAALVFGGVVAVGYHLWGAGIATGIRFTTTGRKALDPTATPVLLESLLYDIGLTYALAIGGILLTLRRRAWNKALLMIVMLGAGSVIQASSLRIHEFTSLDKHTAFTALFCAVPAAVALNWAFSRRGRITLVALGVIWLLLIDGMWRSDEQYSWPASIMEPVGEIKTLNIAGQYFSFDADTSGFYTQDDPGIVWFPGADAYSIFGQGLSKVIAVEKSHEFTGFLFQTSNLSTGNVVELKALDTVLAADPYYFETSTFPVTPYTKAVWQLWIHYPASYRGPALRKRSAGSAG
jgi:hypothetical protein